MIAIEQFKEMGIDIDNALIGNTAIEWIANNTTLAVNTNDYKTVEALPFSAKLFIVKYSEVSSIRAGVSSESISGLSQSFNNNDTNALIWNYANELLSTWLISSISFYPAQDRWK